MVGCAIGVFDVSTISGVLGTVLGGALGDVLGGVLGAVLGDVLGDVLGVVLGSVVGVALCDTSGVGESEGGMIVCSLAQPTKSIETSIVPVSNNVSFLMVLFLLYASR